MATEYQLLFDLSVNAGLALTHDQLLQGSWDSGRQGDLRVLRLNLRRLPRKPGEDANSPTYFFAELRVG